MNTPRESNSSKHSKTWKCNCVKSSTNYRPDQFHHFRLFELLVFHSSLGGNDRQQRVDFSTCTAFYHCLWCFIFYFFCLLISPTWFCINSFSSSKKTVSIIRGSTSFGKSIVSTTAKAIRVITTIVPRVLLIRWCQWWSIEISLCR